MRTFILLTCFAGLLAAVPVGIEPVTVTGADGTEQMYFRINTGTEVIEEFPGELASPPRLPSDTGVLWVDRNHRAAICQSIALSGDGKHVLANWSLNQQRAGYYRTLATNVPVWESPGSYRWAWGGRQAGASEDGSVLSLSSSSRCYRWSRNCPTPEWTYAYPTSYHGLSRTSHDGSVVAAAQGGTVYAFDPASGDTLWTAPFSGASRLQGIDLTDDGSIVAVTIYDSCMVYENGTRRGAVPIGTSACGTQYAAALSGDGSLLVTGNFYGYVRLYKWNGTSYTQKWVAHAGTPWVCGVDISRDGSTIASGSGYQDGKLCVFDSSSHVPLWTYQDYGSAGAYVPSVALSADGSRIAAASWGDRATSGQFKVFTVHNRSDTTPLVTIIRDQELGSLFCCDISNDGQFAVCGGKAVHSQVMGNGGEVYAVLIGAAESTNVGMQAITSPEPFLQVGTQVFPEATVGNFGDDSTTFFTHLKIHNTTDSTVYHDSSEVIDLAPQQSRSLMFATWTPATYDYYRFEFHTVLTGDQYPGDDSLALRAKCFHDALPTGINPPCAENTVNHTLTPRVSVRNNGSYTEAMSCRLVICDSAGTTVYTDSNATTPLAPEASATVSFAEWTPSTVGPYTATAVACAPEDLFPDNDTLDKEFAVSWEIMYDDGGPSAYYWVGRRDNDKFYVRFTPTISPPFTIVSGRIYVNMANTPFDYVLVCEDNAGVPDTTRVLETVNNVTAPRAPGWAEFDLDIVRPESTDFWLVAHWPDGSPAMGVGADNSAPINLRSYFSSNQDPLELWTRHDWMMRLTQSPEVGIQGPVAQNKLQLRLLPPAPNPFSGRVSLKYEVPRAARVRLVLYDAAGRQVACLADGMHQPGPYTANWRTETAHLTAGIYFAKLLLPDTGESRVRKLILAH